MRLDSHRHGDAAPDALHHDSSVEGCPAPERPRVAVVDPLPVVREGIRALLQGVRGIGDVTGFGSVDELLAEATPRGALVVLLEPRLRALRLPVALDRIRQHLPAARVLVWYAALSEEEAQDARAHGAAGLLSKDADVDAIGAAVAAALQRDRRATTPSLRTEASRRPAADQLTPREFSVLRLLCDGLSNAEIASSLNISHGTTKVYMSRVLAKLGAQDRTQAVVFSLREQLVAPPC